MKHPVLYMIKYIMILCCYLWNLNFMSKQFSFNVHLMNLPIFRWQIKAPLDRCDGILILKP